MTTFLSISQPQQPAFIYASYPAGTVATAAFAASGSDPAAVLLADECNGVAFSSPGSGRWIQLSYPSPVTCDCVAIAGAGLAGVTVAVYGSNDNFATQVTLHSGAVAAQDNAFWCRHAAVSYSAYRYGFYNTNSATKVKHIAAAQLRLSPYPEDGFCSAPLQAEGDHLISYAGLYLGSVTQRVMRPFSLSFGQVTPVEKTLFDDLMAACLQNAQALFFVPDTGDTVVHFGWIDKKFKYEPKMQNGMYTIPAIPFTSRAGP